MEFKWPKCSESDKIIDFSLDPAMKQEVRGCAESDSESDFEPERPKRMSGPRSKAKGNGNGKGKASAEGSTKAGIGKKDESSRQVVGRKRPLRVVDGDTEDVVKLKPKAKPKAKPVKKPTNTPTDRPEVDENNNPIVDYSDDWWAIESDDEAESLPAQSKPVTKVSSAVVESIATSAASTAADGGTSGGDGGPSEATLKQKAVRRLVKTTIAVLKSEGTEEDGEAGTTTAPALMKALESTEDVDVSEFDTTIRHAAGRVAASTHPAIVESEPRLVATINPDKKRRMCYFWLGGKSKKPAEPKDGQESDHESHQGDEDGDESDEDGDRAVRMRGMVVVPSMIAASERIEGGALQVVVISAVPPVVAASGSNPDSSAGMTTATSTTASSKRPSQPMRAHHTVTPDLMFFAAKRGLFVKSGEFKNTHLVHKPTRKEQRIMSAMTSLHTNDMTKPANLHASSSVAVASKTNGLVADPLSYGSSSSSSSPSSSSSSSSSSSPQGQKRPLEEVSNVEESEGCIKGGAKRNIEAEGENSSEIEVCLGTGGDSPHSTSSHSIPARPISHAIPPHPISAGAALEATPTHPHPEAGTEGGTDGAHCPQDSLQATAITTESLLLP